MCTRVETVRCCMEFKFIERFFFNDIHGAFARFYTQYGRNPTEIRVRPSRVVSFGHRIVLFFCGLKLVQDDSIEETSTFVLS